MHRGKGVDEEKEDKRIGELIASFVHAVQYPQVPALMDLVEDPPFPCWPPAPFIVIIKNWAFCHLFTLFLLLQRIPVARNRTKMVRIEKGQQPASGHGISTAISKLPSNY
ncbi:hypothetical protein CI102_9044 [Trichoderma harzianum]|nr:hypothetical protein CI102_9044 [Trichoderma harzianum]